MYLGRYSSINYYEYIRTRGWLDFYIFASFIFLTMASTRYLLMKSLSFFVMLLPSGANGVSVSALWSLAVDCFTCPTSDQYDPECLKNAIPPWPICLFHDVDYFVEKSKDGASRCCTDDLTECRCPKKDTPQFLDQIEGWCQGIQKCMPCKGKGCHQGEDQEEHVEVVPEDHLPYEFSNREVSSFFPEPGCPTDDSYDPNCLESAIPPFPICLKHTVDEWVSKALQGHEDCCNNDLDACSCPKKNTSMFIGKISDWCARVETCETPVSSNILVGSLRATPERLEKPEQP